MTQGASICLMAELSQVQVPLQGMDFGPQRQLVIGLGFLMSYEHMGYALVACLEVWPAWLLYAALVPSSCLRVVGLHLQLTFADHAPACCAHRGHVCCTQGCACPPKEFNLLHGFRISMTYWKTLNVVLSEGSQQCTLGLVNSAKTKSLEHKIKVRLHWLQPPAVCMPVSGEWLSTL